MPSPVPDLEATTAADLRRDGRGGTLCRLARALGWGVTGAVVVGGAWAVAVVAVRVASRGTGWPIPGDAQLLESSLILAAICGGWGIIIGAVAGSILGRQRAGAVVLWALGMAATGAGGGALVLPLVAATRHSLPAEVSSSLAFAVAGLLAGLVGSVYGRGVAGPSQRAAILAAGWGVTGAVVAGGAWAGGLLLARHFFQARFGVVTPDGLMTESAITAAIGFVGGLVAEVAVGLARGRDRRNPVMGVLAVAAVGGAAVGLTPVVPTAARRWLTPEVSSTVYWAVIGLLTGLVGYTWGREWQPPELADEDELPGEQPERPRVRRSARRPAPAGPLVRLLPIFAISSGCVLAAAVGSPSPAGWAVLAVGLLGFAAAWAFAGQERRIAELERQLRERQERG